MTLDSLFFLSVFLPLTVGAYAMIQNKKARQFLLLAAGLVFYAFGSLQGLVVLLISAAFNYIFCVCIHRGRFAKAICILAVAANLLLLGTYKYLDFFLGEILGTTAQLSLLAPMGISFFTFKCISCAVDTYRDRESGPRKFTDFLLYVSFFPQITSGPICRYGDFVSQVADPTWVGAASGMRRFVIGLAKKTLLASTLGAVSDAVFASALPDARGAWVGALAYALQIYLDFSGYSDMAIGLGNVFGYGTKENFLHPYTADSLTDFWRRWHISLSSWFKDYLYIPLGGNRKGKHRAALNKLIVFALCGLWHGANWTFLLWGAWHGVLSALESTKLIRPRKLPGRVYTLLVVCIGFVMFRAETVTQGLAMICAMFTGWKPVTEVTVLLHRVLDLRVLTAAMIGILACVDWKQVISKKNQSLWATIERVSYPACVVLFVLCLLRLASGGFAPFIYAQF